MAQTVKSVVYVLYRFGYEGERTRVQILGAYEDLHQAQAQVDQRGVLIDENEKGELYQIDEESVEVITETFLYAEE